MDGTDKPTAPNVMGESDKPLRSDVVGDRKTLGQILNLIAMKKSDVSAVIGGTDLQSGPAQAFDWASLLLSSVYLIKLLKIPWFKIITPRALNAIGEPCIIGSVTVYT